MNERRPKEHHMNQRHPIRILTGLILTGALVAACTGSGASSAPTIAPEAATATPEAMESTEAMDSPEAMESHEAMMDEPFGVACAAVPTDGAGSFAGMATDPVATAASNNPVLSTLVTAVTEAGLGDTLNTAEDITVFAPTNDAFSALDPATLDAAMADPTGLLTTVLTYHVVGGRLTPEQLAGTHTTLQGGTIEVTGSGEDFMVNGTATIVCGNVQTANATVYIIDGVLLPPAS
jgi:uncharacterized surface protein with fasciclin (FAS1) repeats